MNDEYDLNDGLEDVDYEDVYGDEERICEKCGMKYKVIDDINEYNIFYNFENDYTFDIIGNLCSGCAIEEMQNYFEENEESCK